MSRLYFVISLFFLVMAGSALAQSGSAPAEPEAVVTVAPEENGNWSVEYRFDAPQSVLAFARSENDYRGATWFLESEGARFGRLADFDVIVFDEPATRVSFSIIPLTSKLAADYTPFVTFGDGGLAIYDGQFSLIPFDTAGDVEALDGDASKAGRGPLPMALRVASDKAIIINGEVHQGEVTHLIEGDGTYVYLGDGEIQPFDSFTVILDKTLPDWLQARFDSDLEAIFAGLEARWGFELEDKATVLLAYKGGKGQSFSASGGALDRLLMMEVGGTAFAEPDFDTLSYLQWFFAHEAVHLFQTAKGVQFPGNGDSWIHEGAANTMAYSLIAELLGPQDGPQFLAGVYANAFDTCVSELEKGSLETVGERDAFSTHYACGDFIALATDGFLKRRDLYGFWNTLVERAPSVGDGKVDAKLYFLTMQLLGATKAQRDMVRSLVEDELDDPRNALTQLLEKAGLAPEFNANGQLIKLDWPDYSAE